MKEDKELKETENRNPTKIYFYISIACCVLCAVAFGLSFLPALGIYALISGILLGLCALSFISTQKKKYNFKAVLYVKIVSYVLLGACAALFIGGLIYSAIV